METGIVDLQMSAIQRPAPCSGLIMSYFQDIEVRVPEQGARLTNIQGQTCTYYANRLIRATNDMCVVGAVTIRSDPSLGHGLVCDRWLLFLRCLKPSGYFK